MGAWLSTEGISGKRIAVALAVAVLLADQLSKQWVRATVPLSTSTATSDEPFLRISNVVNSGIFLGISAPVAVLIPLAVAAGAILLLVYWRYAPANNRLLAVSIGLLVGGCTGNLVDRVVFGGVTDMIDVRVSASLGRVVFNVADLCCVAGMVAFDVFLVRLRLVKVPRNEYMIPYILRWLVGSEMGRSQNSRWRKAAFLRLGIRGMMPASSTAPTFEPTGESSSAQATRSS